MALPSLVAQHDHGIAAGAIVIGGAERPAHHRVHAHDIEEAARHEVDRHHPAVDTQIDLGQRRVGVRKDARFRTQRFETRTGEQRALAVCLPRPLDGVHLGNVRDCVAAEEQRVQDGEEDRYHAEPDRNGHDNREGRQRRALECAQGVLNIADGVVDERGAALVAAFVSGDARRSKPRLRIVAGRARRHALVDQLLRFALDVKCELIVQLLLDAVWPEQRARPQFQVVKIHGVRRAS